MSVAVMVEKKRKFSTVCYASMLKNPLRLFYVDVEKGGDGVLVHCRKGKMEGEMVIEVEGAGGAALAAARTDGGTRVRELSSLVVVVLPETKISPMVEATMAHGSVNGERRDDA
ncbi:hypothetical protein FXO37_04396 [Capsicum annuum]|nr:hypothetical protein FXO37_04396 [Capsicum annuum]